MDACCPVAPVAAEAVEASSSSDNQYSGSGRPLFFVVLDSIFVVSLGPIAGLLVYLPSIRCFQPHPVANAASSRAGGDPPTSDPVGDRCVLVAWYEYTENGGGVVAFRAIYL